MKSRYYVYLTENDWAEAWVKGGVVPIRAASTYLADYREGTRTPDETIQRTIWGMPDKIVQGPFMIAPGANLTLKNLAIQIGDESPTYVRHGFAGARIEDGLILSLSTELSAALATRLEKTACVEIRCMACLIETLDSQIGIKCKAASINYTSGYARNHFLKSREDAWQHEYRLFWNTHDIAERQVVLPPGIASRIDW